MPCGMRHTCACLESLISSSPASCRRTLRRRQCSSAAAQSACQLHISWLFETRRAPPPFGLARARFVGRRAGAWRGQKSACSFVLVVVSKALTNLSWSRGGLSKAPRRRAQGALFRLDAGQAERAQSHGGRGGLRQRHVCVAQLIRDRVCRWRRPHLARRVSRRRLTCADGRRQCPPHPCWTRLVSKRPPNGARSWGPRTSWHRDPCCLAGGGPQCQPGSFSSSGCFGADRCRHLLSGIRLPHFFFFRSPSLPLPEQDWPSRESRTAAPVASLL